MVFFLSFCTAEKTVTNMLFVPSMILYLLRLSFAVIIQREFE